MNDLRSYANSKSKLEFLRALSHRMRHLEWALADLERLAGEGERILSTSPAASAFSLSPLIVRGSTIVMAYGFTEGFLVDLARAHAQSEASCISISDWRVSRLDKARTYFKSTAGLAFPDERPSWANLKAIGLLRHALVHSLGRLSDPRKRTSVAALPAVSVSDVGEVWLENGAPTSLIRNLRTFAQDLEASLGGAQA